ncbi:MAG: hypothetical protein WD533_07525 [Dehalococcoidia bacterium]
MTTPAGNPEDRIARLERFFIQALDTLDAASPLGKGLHRNHVFELALRLLKEPGGPEVLYRYASRFDSAGVFLQSDWAFPARLRPEAVSHALHQRGLALAIECLSEIRLLAIANGGIVHPDITAEDARSFLESAVGFNLDLLYPDSSEATRIMRTETPELMDGVQRLFEFIIDQIGAKGIRSRIIDESERILRQRPILVRRVKTILDSVSHTLSTDQGVDVDDRTAVLINALHGPTPLSREAGSLEAYGESLLALDPESLRSEAKAFGDAMWATGLVARQHATLLRHLNNAHGDLLPAALGLEEAGRATLSVHRALVGELIDIAIHPETAQSIYGLANLLVSGLNFFSPMPPSLRRVARLPITESVAVQLDSLLRRDEPLHSLTPNAILLAGTLSVLGQPLGIGQGDNPTCQSARAISLWAQGDPAYLLELLAQAAHDDSITMHFEGTPIHSGRIPPGMAVGLHTELDAVSLVLVPHLDRIYVEMGRSVAGRGDDGHRWINPEFHGWPVHRGFSIAVDVATGSITQEQFESFVRLFYAAYHPNYRGEAQIIHPQPVGIASTDHNGVFIGWHAVSIQRVFRRADGEMRLYFYNPNNDGGQDWGQGIVTSTSGKGELAGESSLPFQEFAARLYLFHYNLREYGDPNAVPANEVGWVVALARASWGASFPWIDASSASAPPMEGTG